MEPETPKVPGRSAPAFVTLHFLRSAVLRRRLVCLLGSLVGLLAAVAFLVAVPQPHSATTTLVLAHDPQADPEIAMATDVSLATTRTVAKQTIDQLGLQMSPVDLLRTVTAVATTSDVLTITLKAPSDDQAVRTLETFSSVFLDFRAGELSAQSSALVTGMNKRIDKLQDTVDELTQRIDRNSNASDSEASPIADTISQRAQVVVQITALQQSVQDATLKTTSLVAGSRVIDAPAAELRGGKRRMVFALASGLVAGTGLAVGIVLFLAITSDRVRRRIDVANALEVPVIVSVGRLAPISGWLRRIPVLKGIDRRRADDRRRLAHTIVSSVPSSGMGQWLAVACIDNADEVRFGVVEAAMDLQRRGVGVRLIDLTEKGNLNAAVQRMRLDEANRPAVSRPRGIPSLVTEAGQIETYGAQTRSLPQLKDTEVCLTVADLNPSVGAEHLTVWTQRVVMAVTAGLSSAERVTTARDLIDAAELEMWCAMLIRAEPTDHSSGSLLVVGVPDDE